MPHLVACCDCHRKYKARDDKVGTRFRCRCGNVLTVAAPQEHDSPVIRCSSCAAPRAGMSQSCGHCGADFTLHERDLHTVCPSCMTRVSDHARYCHSCGGLLTADETIGEATTHHCPSCLDEPFLHSRSLGERQLSVLECDACAGLWLDAEIFKHLARQAQDVRVPSVARGAQLSNRPQPDPPPQRSGYCPCPMCGQFMNRRNYGFRRGRGGSGIVIEYCKSHGIWFNCGELAAILTWLRTDGTVDELGRPELESGRSPDPAVFYAPSRDDSQDSEFTGLLDLVFDNRRGTSFHSTSLFDILFRVRFGGFGL